MRQGPFGAKLGRGSIYEVRHGGLAVGIGAVAVAATYAKQKSPRAN
jgi:hypothetical protein